VAEILTGRKFTLKLRANYNGYVCQTSDKLTLLWDFSLTFALDSGSKWCDDEVPFNSVYSNKRKSKFCTESQDRFVSIVNVFLALTVFAAVQYDYWEYFFISRIDEKQLFNSGFYVRSLCRFKVSILFTRCFYIVPLSLRFAPAVPWQMANFSP